MRALLQRMTAAVRRLGRTVFALTLVRRKPRGELPSSRELGPAGTAPPSPPEDPRKLEVGSDPRAELGVGVLLILAGLLATSVLVLIAVRHPNTQLLGVGLGGALVCVAAALVLAAQRVAPRETAVEERAVLDEPAPRTALEETLRGGVEGISRRRLLTSAAGVAGLGFGAAFVGTAASLGPNVGQRINDTPWHRGRRIVDQGGRPLLADDIVEGAFTTGFPEGADPRELGAPIVIVRIDPSTLRMPAARRTWTPEGLIAYSKICTHAGCAVALFRSPLSPSTSPNPALVCPCHYSTFDVARAAKVIFGPAGRPLPQLPLTIGAGRELIAGGGFSGSIGPAWWSVHR